MLPFRTRLFSSSNGLELEVNSGQFILHYFQRLCLPSNTPLSWWLRHIPDDQKRSVPQCRICHCPQIGWRRIVQGPHSRIWTKCTAWQRENFTHSGVGTENACTPQRLTTYSPRPRPTSRRISHCRGNGLGGLVRFWLFPRIVETPNSPRGNRDPWLHPWNCYTGFIMSQPLRVKISQIIE